MVSAVAILGLVSLAAAVPGGSATASTPSPIKLMVISSVNNAASNNPQVFSAAQAAAHSINAKGGVNHHKIRDPHVQRPVRADGRRRVCPAGGFESRRGGLGTLSVLSDSINPILQQANIASVGSVPITDSDDTNPVSFPIEAALAMDYFADAQALADKGVTKIGFALLAATAALNLAAPVEQALKEGKIKTPKGKVVKFAGETQLSLTAANYSSYLFALKNDGAQGVIPIALVSQTVGMITTSKQLGLGFTFASDTETMYTQVLAQTGSAALHVVITGSLPNPVSSTRFPGVVAFQKDMLAAHKAGIGNTQKSLWTDAALNSWLSVYVIAAVAKRIKGAINNANVPARPPLGEEDQHPGTDGTVVPRQGRPERPVPTHLQHVRVLLQGSRQRRSIQLEYQKPFDIAKLLP